MGAVTSGVLSSLCIDDSQSSTSPGNPVHIWGCDNTDAQSWTIAPNETISALGLCLDVIDSRTSNGTLIELWQCNGTGAQQWQIKTNGALVNPESGLCLDDPNSSTTSGTQLQLYTGNSADAQDWTLPSRLPLVRALTADQRWSLGLGRSKLVRCRGSTA
ncbi:MAG TPA: ricin-type beta-trefoil lectin domain protein [Pseudonocardiaceae bacterium]|nr:ricin-type beta-trefoil lectin domain protein [Pseudonocardiaceae bacterium]